LNFFLCGLHPAQFYDFLYRVIGIELFEADFKTFLFDAVDVLQALQL
jgi:hypothetical protein